MSSTPSPGSIDFAWESEQAPGQRSLTPSLGGSDSDEEERATLPPPLPLNEYVQAMMQRADEADEGEDERPPPSRAPLSWRNAPTIRMASVPPDTLPAPEPAPAATSPQQAKTVAMPSVARAAQGGTPPSPPVVPAPPAPRAPFDTLEDFHDLPGVGLDAGLSSLRDERPWAESLVEDHDTFDEIERSTIPGQPAPDPFADIQRRLDLGDESGALIIAETMLASQPDNLEAKRAAELCRSRLAETYMRRLGGPSRVPRVAVPSEELRFLSLDHRAGFLLSFVDGSMSLEEVLDVASMPLLEALRLLYELCEQGVIDFREPKKRR